VPLIASAARDQANSQGDQRRRDQQSTEPRYYCTQRASIGLSEPEVDKEAARLGHDSR
jgi:hypothetical protein